MPRVVPCYRTWNRPKLDKDGNAVPGGGTEPVVERKMMLEPDANEAVRNGRGEWSKQEPKGVHIYDLDSPYVLTESETRAEKLDDRRGGTKFKT